MEIKQFYMEKMSKEQLIATIYHELRHIDTDGEIKPHDIEDWDNMVATLGKNWVGTKADIINILDDEFPGWNELSRVGQQIEHIRRPDNVVSINKASKSVKWSDEFMIIEKINYSAQTGETKNGYSFPDAGLYRAAAAQGVLFSESSLTATNMELGVKIPLEANVEEKPFIIPGKAIELISNLPDEPIEITPDEGNGIIIKPATSNNRFASMDPEAFPVVPFAGKEIVGSVDGTELEKALKSVMYAVATDGGRPILTGVCFDSAGRTAQYRRHRWPRVSWFKMKYDKGIQVCSTPATLSEAHEHRYPGGKSKSPTARIKRCLQDKGLHRLSSAD
jgi:hypothetical protein